MRLQCCMSNGVLNDLMGDTKDGLISLMCYAASRASGVVEERLK